MASLKSTLGAGATGLAGAGALFLWAQNMRNSSNLNSFGSSLYFPNDLGTDSHPHYISFSFQEYKRRSIFERGFLKDQGMIRLSMPGSMVNASDVNYTQSDSGVITGAVLENAIGAGKSVSDAMVSALTIPTVAGAAAIQKLVLGSNGLPSGMRDQALQLGGVAQNPFLTVLFKSPTFKRHSFSWLLNPENAHEVETVRNIINKFDYHKLADISGYSAGTLLTYPDIVLIGYYPDDKYLYKFKPCVIESFVANYSPEGQASFFNAVDAPTSVEIRLNLLEIEYWTKPDVLIAQGLLDENYRVVSPLNSSDILNRIKPQSPIPGPLVGPGDTLP